MRPVLVRRFL
ncbi:hypothetical protein E2C01_049708 [Portunus trituberculatus]|uniref:Uncharacterized protein n=1 Tax=Portunus trituberculatus TaxID=210409 RepID=A0A5B7GGT3_PORTR|nr:hypothetical protein [Portunus trituberculatus]